MPFILGSCSSCAQMLTEYVLYVLGMQICIVDVWLAMLLQAHVPLLGWLV